MSVNPRPGGVTLLALVVCIFGILLLVGSAELLVAASFVEEYIDLLREGIGAIPNLPSGIDLVEIVTAVFTAIAVVLIALGIVNFPLAWGIFTGRGWAWSFSVIISVVWMIIGVVTLIAVVGVFILIIAALILYYLYRPHIKEFFGKGAPRAFGPVVGPI